MEALMQYVWQFRLWPTSDMVTTDGRRIVVLDPGLHNHDSGPDFFNAKVLIGSESWSGNVEIHVNASDWFRHHHDNDPAYDSVVLHVVDRDDAQICRKDGQKIPQMVMKCAPDFASRYNEMVNNPYRELPCGNELEQVPSLYLTDWFSALAFERLYAKAERIEGFLKASNYNWQQAIYITLARALGFSTNSDPFQLLAQTTPLQCMLHHSDSLISVEAILFGQAGMLEGLNPGDDRYLNRLISEYRFLATKYNLQRSKNIMWKMARMRPQNFPHRRIAALAHLIHQNPMFTSALLEIRTEQDARRLFDIALEGFWATHYHFHGLNEGSALHSDEGRPRPDISAEPAATPTKTRALSWESINVLIINVVVPVMFAYAQYTGDSRRQEQAVELLESLRPESNRIIETFGHAGIKATNAFTTQALIQLKRDYCEPRKCLFCRIGHRLLSAKVRRLPSPPAP